MRFLDLNFYATSNFGDYQFIMQRFKALTIVFLFSVFSEYICSAYKQYDCKPSTEIKNGKIIYLSTDGKKYEFKTTNTLTTATNEFKKETDLVLEEAYNKKGFVSDPGTTIIKGKPDFVRLDSQSNAAKGHLNLAIQTNGRNSKNVAGAYGPINFFNHRGNACDALQRSLTGNYNGISGQPSMTIHLTEMTK